MGISRFGVDTGSKASHDAQRPKQAATETSDQAGGCSTRKQEPESMKRLAEGTPANQVGSSEPAGQPGARSSAPSMRRGSSTGAPNRKIGNGLPRREARRQPNAPPGAGGDHRESASSEGAAPVPASNPDPDGGRVRSGAGSQRRTERRPGDSGPRLGAVRDGGQGAGRIRSRTSQHRRIRREDAVGGRRNRSPEKLTGESRKAARGFVASTPALPMPVRPRPAQPMPAPPMPVQSRRCPYISARGSGGGHDW